MGANRAVINAGGVLTALLPAAVICPHLDGLCQGLGGLRAVFAAG